MTIEQIFESMTEESRFSSEQVWLQLAIEYAQAACRAITYRESAQDGEEYQTFSDDAVVAAYYSDFYSCVAAWVGVQ